ncbi:MAG: hypothetical protein J2P47_05140, partial [Acetobacteraceae bacterium]|nr:hypothetical protein [Acetobacteraceae bacterium]
LSRLKNCLIRSIVAHARCCHLPRATAGLARPTYYRTPRTGDRTGGVPGKLVCWERVRLDRVM